MSSASSVWPILHHDDTRATLRYLTDVLGFGQAAVAGDGREVVRVEGAGGEVVEAPHETRFGSGVTARVLTVRDSEGNPWTFGTYAGSADR